MTFPTWDALTRGFVAGYDTLYQRALGQVDGFVASRRQDAAALVAGFLETLTHTAGVLAQVGAHLAFLPGDAASDALRRRYVEMTTLHAHLVEAFRAQTVVGTDGKPPPGVTEVGALPIVIGVVIEGVIWVGVTAAGVAIAMAAWDYAKGTQQHAEALLGETNGRVEAMRTGKELPAGDVAKADQPAPPDKPPEKGGWGVILLLGAAAAGAAFLLPKLTKG